MSAAKTIYEKAKITSKDIIEAYETHGDDFVIPDIDNIRPHQDLAQYINLNIKLANGKIITPTYWKLSEEGIITGSRIKAPELRQYEQVRVGLVHYDSEMNESDNMKAMKVLCEAYERKMKQFKSDNQITDDEDNSPSKQADGKFRPVYLISTKIKSPMQATTKDKETGDTKKMDNPFYWISLSKKRFFNSNEVKKEPVHYENKYYLKADGSPNLMKPIMSFEYAPTFYNVDDFYFHPRTGKKIFNKLGDLDEATNEFTLNNLNVHSHLTRGSIMVGNIKFEIVVSGRQAKLEFNLYGTNLVKKAELGDYDNGMDEDRMSNFADRYKNLAAPKVSEFDIPEEDGDDDE
jgi:hypothetical protein